MIVLSCSNISKSYGVNSVLEDISFTIENGDKIGLIGLNGSGKTTLFNILSGEDLKDNGDIYVQKDLKIGYLKQHTNIESNLTVFEECLEVFKSLIEMEKDIRKLEEKISQIGENRNSEKLDSLLNEYSILLDEFNEKNGYGYKSEIKGILKGLGFSEEEMDRNSNVLSGGQKARLSLAKLLLNKPDILLLDEPTNHLDISAITWLEGFLKEYNKAVLVISHDRYFLNKVANKIFKMDKEAIEVFLGNYNYYLEKRKQEQLLAEGKELKPIFNKTQLKQERRKEREYRQAFRDQQEAINSLEITIGELEEKIYVLEQIMCQPNFYDDIDKAQAISQDYNDVKVELKEIMVQWEENMLLLEEMES